MQPENQEIIKLVESFGDQVTATGEVPTSLIEDFESSLDLQFPESYKIFLNKYGTIKTNDTSILGICFPGDKEPSFVWALQALFGLSPDIPKNLIPIELLEDGISIACLNCRSTTAESSEAPIVLWDLQKPTPDQSLLPISSNFFNYLFRRLNASRFREEGLREMQQHVTKFEEEYLSISKIPRNHIWRPFRFCVQDVVLGLVVVKHSLENNNLEVDVCLTSDAPDYEIYSGAKMTLAFLLSEAYKCGGNMGIRFTENVEGGTVPVSIRILAEHLGVGLEQMEDGRISPSEAKLLYLKLTNFSLLLIEEMLKLVTNSKLPRSKLRGIHNGTIVMGAAAPKPLLAHSSRQQADGYSGNTNKLSPESVCFAVQTGIWTKSEVESLILGSHHPDSILKGESSPEQRILFLHDLNHSRSAILGGYLERKLLRRERSDGDIAIDLEDDTRRLDIKFDSVHYAKTYVCDDEELPLPWGESSYMKASRVSIGQELVVLIRPRNTIEIAREFKNDLAVSSRILGDGENKNSKPQVFLLYPKDFDEFIFREGEQITNFSEELGVGILVCPETIASIDMDASNRLLKSRILRQ